MFYSVPFVMNENQVCLKGVWFFIKRREICLHCNWAMAAGRKRFEEREILFREESCMKGQILSGVLNEEPADTCYSCYCIY